ncbi:hypothetical protein [Streptomyces sp. NPDC000880]
MSKTIEASSGRARPLLHAAALYHHGDGHPPETALYPLITARNGTDSPPAPSWFTYASPS